MRISVDSECDREALETVLELLKDRTHPIYRGKSSKKDRLFRVIIAIEDALFTPAAGRNPPAMRSREEIQAAHDALIAALYREQAEGKPMYQVKPGIALAARSLCWVLDHDIGEGTCFTDERGSIENLSAVSDEARTRREAFVHA